MEMRLKALVLAGGTGTRLRPLSHTRPKQLMPVAGKPVIAHCLQALADIGVREVGVVVGDRGEQIRAAVGDGSAFGLRITYLWQERPRGLADAVRIGRGFLGDDDFVVHLGDTVLVGGIGASAGDFRRLRPAAQVVVAKVADPGAYGVAEVDVDGRVTALAEKPDRPRSNLALAGVYFCTPEVHRAVARVQPGVRGEVELTDAFADLVRAGRPVRASRFDGYWNDAGTVDGLLDCDRVLLDGVAARVDGSVDDASELIGEVVVGPGATVVRSRVVGPALIGAGSVVADSTVGPYTSVGRDCVLRGAGVERSLLLDAVTVERVHGVRRSVLGRGAVLRAAAGHGPAQAATARLVLGDDALVEFGR